MLETDYLLRRIPSLKMVGAVSPFLHTPSRHAQGWLLFCFQISCGLGSVVGIATAYGLDGPGIEARWGRDFPHLSRPALRTT